MSTKKKNQKRRTQDRQTYDKQKTGRHNDKNKQASILRTNKQINKITQNTKKKNNKGVERKKPFSAARKRGKMLLRNRKTKESDNLCSTSPQTVTF